MQEVFRHITDYMQYLWEGCGLFVSVHNLPLAVMDTLCDINFLCNRHTNPYCIALKTNMALFERCRAEQIAAARHCGVCGTCSGICHAGVLEYLYPVPWDGETGFISVSGYRPADDSPDGEKALHKRGVCCEQFGLDAAEVAVLYRKYLTEDIPDRAWLDVLIHPLQDMLSIAIASCCPAESTDSASDGNPVLFHKICTYLQMHYNKKIGMDELCRTLHYSESYISRVFRCGSGRSVQRYIQELRTEEAKLLLVSTAMTVREIAQYVGFGDSNYFSTVFRSIAGISPRTYRKQNQKQNQKQNRQL